MQLAVYVGSRFIAMNQRTFRQLPANCIKCGHYLPGTAAYDILMEELSTAPNIVSKQILSVSRIRRKPQNDSAKQGKKDTII